MSSTVRVLDLPQPERRSGGRPDHWVNEHGTAFRNPWASWRDHDWRDQLYIAFKHSKQCPSPPANMSSLLPSQRPTWKHEEQNSLKLKATWIGHASFFVELPSRTSTGSKAVRGARIIFDPIFSERCSPVQWAGFKRITPPACSLEELPEVDVVVISHDHYDHLDRTTITKLASLPRPPHFFAPLGNLATLQSFGVPESNCHILDWWEGRRVEVQISSKNETVSAAPALFDLTCTPCQHNVGRNLMDRFYDPTSLWASWAVQEVLLETPALGKSAFFAGDTGYRAVLDHQDEDKVPVCEAFKQIGERFGGFDLAMIPIGAYMPRRFMSPVHCSPKESAMLFKDIKAKHGLGMHWGTFILTTEPIMEPPIKLKEACKEVGIEDGKFICSDIGQTMLY